MSQLCGLPSFLRFGPVPSHNLLIQLLEEKIVYTVIGTSKNTLILAKPCVEENSFTQISKFNFLMEKCNLHCLKSHFYRIAASKVPLSIIDMFVIYHKQKVSLINHKTVRD